MKKIILCGTLLLATSLGTLEASSLGGYTGASLRLADDAINAGLAGITLFASTGTFSFATNPTALTSRQDRRFTGSTAQLALDRYLYTAGLNLPLPPTAFLGVGVQAMGTRNITARDSRGIPAGELSDAEQHLILAFANRLSDRLSAGFSLRLLTRRFSSRDTNWLDLKSRGVGVNAGIRLDLDHLGVLTAVLRDLNGSYSWKTQDLFPQGASYQDDFPASLAWGWQKSWDKLIFSLEHDWYFLGEHRGRMAVAWMGIPALELRGGLILDGAGVSGGLGAGYAFDLSHALGMQIDLGLTSGVPGEGLRSYLGWQLTF